MFEFILKTKSFNKMLLRILILLAIIALVLLGYKQYVKRNREGFSQMDRFVLKRESSIYDDFYVQVYDELYKPTQGLDYITKSIVSNTQASPESSTILDVGSSTGHLVNSLKQLGYTAYGVDKSKAMIDYSESIYPEIDCKTGDVIDPMTFDKSTFSHILCTNMTIYEIQNKDIFFSNCYFWIKPGGYLVLHLAEPDKFDTIVPAGKPTGLKFPQSYSPDRITETSIDFYDFNYRGKYDFNQKKTDTVTFSETFTDKDTGNIRQNEKTLYMEPVQSILKIAKLNGFIVHGKSEMQSDKHQFLYYLERSL